MLRVQGAMCAALIEVIRERQEAILDRFMGLLRRRRGGLDLPASCLLDHIPAFLASLADDLRDDSADASDESTELADAHGALRWQQGFDLAEVIGDYAILHEAILVECEHARVSPSATEARRLVRRVAGGIAAAVAAFVAMQHERDRVSGERLDDLQRVRREILSTVSHELRTPLHVIHLCTELLRPTVRDDDLGASVDIIARNVARESKLVDDLLEMAALVTGRVRLSWGRVDLSEVANEAVAAVRPTADAKGLGLDDAQIQRGAHVDGDRARLYQCVWHLLRNAVKFTPAGGEIRVAVEPSADTSARAWVLSVRDSGPGIAPAFLAQVFDPFAQQDGSTTRTADGLGLGLSLVRHIVELHAGTVAIESGEGEGGTAVFVRLPAPASRG